MLVNFIRTDTYITHDKTIIVIKRTMMGTSRLANSAYKVVVTVPSTHSSPTQALRQGAILNNQQVCNMSLQRTFRFNKKGKGTPYTTDNNNNHTSAVKIECKKTECFEKTCLSPCDEIAEAKVVGHLTHKPPADPHKDSVLLANVDVDGKQKDQHFVKEKAGPKTIPANNLHDLTEDDMTPKKNAQSYLEQPNIKETLENFLK